MVDTYDILEKSKHHQDCAGESEDLDGIKPFDDFGPYSVENDLEQDLNCSAGSCRLIYSKEELLYFRESPLSQIRSSLDLSSKGCWKNAVEEFKKRPADPRERTKREGDGLILSPQRGANFKLGCSVVHPSQGQPISFQPRRIGSGRLNNREWEGVDDRMDEEFAISRRKKFNSVSPEGIRRQTERPVRQPNGKFRGEMELGGRGQQKRPMNGHNMFGLNSPPQRHRYGSDRRNSYGSDTPEWFTEGPTSRNDQVELHGFDGPESPDGFVFGSSPPSEASCPNDLDIYSATETPPELALPLSEAEPDFNIDDFIQFDDILPRLAENEIESAANEIKVQQSRFSQFFNAADAKNNSEHQESTMTVVNDMAAIDRVPRYHADNLDTNAMVAALCAGVTNYSKGVGYSPEPAVEQFASNSAANFIAQFGETIYEPRLKNLTENFKIMSVDELEAQVLTNHQHNLNRPMNQQNENRFRPIHPVKPQKQDANPCKTPAPHKILDKAIMEILVERGLVNKYHPQVPRAANFAQQHPMQRPHQTAYPVPACEPLPTVPPELYHAIMQNKPTPDISSRPDYINLLNAMRQGTLTPQYLIKLLMSGSPHGTSFDPEVMLSALNVVWTTHPAGSPNFSETVTAPPSRNELAAHTANIMQNALIKRKLEEQRENYRRRHDPTETVQPIRNGSPSTVQGMPLAFTPTAVLRQRFNAGHYPSNPTSPQPGGISPLQFLSQDVRSQNENMGYNMNPGFNDGQMSPVPPVTNSNSALYGGVPLQMMKPNQRLPNRVPQLQPTRATTPQAFIGQFAQARMAAPVADAQWWNSEGMLAQMNLPSATHNPPFAHGQMMTVEELEKAQQRANEVVHSRRRARRN